MREEGAAFGGEVSGHYYFRDFWNADSGTIPALLMLELLSVDGRVPAGDPQFRPGSQPGARRTPRHRRCQLSGLGGQFLRHDSSARPAPPDGARTPIATQQCPGWG